ncbi:isoprenylcysteine carboxylmethyltransferase family protein [Gracilimonas sp.]|uniref:methyltransferase family protein n=1 Tax=Gracilimonas sp. TaxID=1974203 RepID=UPI0032F034C2
MKWLKLKIPPALLFLICIGLMWGLDKRLNFEPTTFDFPDWLFGGLVLVGGSIVLLGVIEFSRKSTTVNPHKPQNTTALVKSGIYRFTRNPMYLGMVFILLAGVMKFGNGLTMLIPALFIWYMNIFQVQPEEEMMEQKFGKEFVEYKEEVRRWI